MATEAIQASSGTRNEAYRPLSAREDPTALGKDDFLKLLVAQLRFQDPLAPMNDREFIAELATFSTLEQMFKLNESFNDVRSLLMIGKKVTYAKTNPDGTLTNGTGTVQAVTYKNGMSYLLLDNGESIDVSSVVQVEGSA